MTKIESVTCGVCGKALAARHDAEHKRLLLIETKCLGCGAVVANGGSVVVGFMEDAPPPKPAIRKAKAWKSDNLFMGRGR